MFLVSAAKKLVGVLQFFTHHQIEFVRRNCTAQRDGWVKRNGINERVHCAPNIALSLPKKEPPYLLNCIPLSSLAHLLCEPPSLPPSLPVSPPFPSLLYFCMSHCSSRTMEGSDLAASLNSSRVISSLWSLSILEKILSTRCCGVSPSSFMRIMITVPTIL